MGLLGQRKPNVRSLAQAEDVEGLVEATRYTDRVPTTEGSSQDAGVATRAEAVLALAALDPAETRGALQAALCDPADPVRCAAVRVLHGHKEANVLLDALPRLAVTQGKSLDLARRAVASLRDLIDPREAATALIHAEDGRELSDDDVAMLAMLLGDEDGPPRAKTIGALIDALADDRDAVVDRAADLLVSLAPASTPAVVERLSAQSAPPGVPWVLGRIADPRTAEVLVDGLEHENARVRAECAAGLAEIGDPIAVGPLVRATRDPDPAVRTQAASALDEFGTAAVVVGVAELLRPLVLEAAQTQQAKPRRRAKPKAKPHGQNGGGRRRRPAAGQSPVPLGDAREIPAATPPSV